MQIERYIFEYKKKPETVQFVVKGIINASKISNRTQIGDSLEALHS